MKILFFDTETTGLPQWKGAPTDPKQPDIIQLAAILTDEAGEIDTILSSIINPTKYSPEWTMDPFAEAAHGITTKKVLTEGICGSDVLEDFMNLVKQADLLVCHNVPFDRLLVRVALNRLEKIECDNVILAMDYYCTMSVSTPLCKLVNKRGGAKWPKLIELHNFLFAEDFEDQHDALGDVRATMRCYFELKERGL